MIEKKLKSTAKKLRALARACDREADWCQRASRLCVTDEGVNAKNAAQWRGRSRTCWTAAGLLADLLEAI